MIYYSHPVKIKFLPYGIPSMVNVWVHTMDTMEQYGPSMSIGIQQHLHLHLLTALFVFGMCKQDVKQVPIQLEYHVDVVHSVTMDINFYTQMMMSWVNPVNCVGQTSERIVCLLSNHLV